MNNPIKSTLVTSYVKPDLDGTAGAIAYGEFLEKTINKKVTIGFIGSIHDEAKYIFDHFSLEYPLIIEDSNNFSEVILVDASDVSGLNGKIEVEKVIEIIDHRKINGASEFLNAKAQIEFVGAAATLVAEKFINNNINISKKSALLLYGAIISNTLNFKASVTTNPDLVAAKWFNEILNLPENFWKDLFMAKSDLSGNKLKERMLGELAWFVLGNKKINIIQIEIIGAKKLIKERGQEIIEVLEKIKKEMSIDYIFQNTIELEDSKNYFVTSDIVTQKLLEKIFNIKFNGIVAETPKLIMRKQIIPLLKEELEKRNI